MFDRWQGIWQGNTVKTFCCDSKSSTQVPGRVRGSNLGNNCKPSLTGQCYPGYSGQSYKFRCYNTQMLGTDQNGYRNGTVGDRIQINESDQGEQCKYVA